MKEKGLPAEIVGHMIYKLNEIDLESIPKQKALAEGAKKFTPAALEKTKKWAKWTQQRQLPDNWVAEYIEGNGRDFDFGYDFSECAICKYFHSKKMPELAPFVCLNDFLRSQTLDTGLARNKTLGQGDNVCNFRYKKGRPVTQDWDSEIGLIRNRIAENKICTVPKS